MEYVAFALFWVFLASIIGYWIFVQIRSGDAGSSGMDRRRDENPFAFWVHIACEVPAFLFVAAIAIYVIYKGPAILK